MSEKPQAASAQPSAGDKLADFALSVLSKGKRESPTAEVGPAHDVTEQIAKLAALHAQGILTDVEFANKKAQLLERL